MSRAEVSLEVDSTVLGSKVTEEDAAIKQVELYALTDRPPNSYELTQFGGASSFKGIPVG